MSDAVTKINQLANAAQLSNASAAYLPEPSSTGMGLFRDTLRIASDVAGTLSGGALSGVTDLVVGGSFEDLIAMQLQVQKEMQTTTMISNTEKSRHEAKMSPIRNIRVN